MAANHEYLVNLEAINKFLKTKKREGFPMSRIAKDLGIAPHRLYNMRRGTTSSIELEIYEKFKRKYPSAVKRLFVINPENIVNYQAHMLIRLEKRMDKTNKKVDELIERVTAIENGIQ